MPAPWRQIELYVMEICSGLQQKDRQPYMPAADR